MFFINNYNWLSNMYLFPSPITINTDGVEEVIKSSENYYHSRKTNDPILRAKILKMNPYEAKRYCKKHSGNIDLVDNWDDIKEDVMYEALKIKFSIIPLFLKLIFLTDEIVEDNTWRDTYWGRYNGKGQNRLGILITKLRNEFLSNINYFTGIGSRTIDIEIEEILCKFTKYLTTQKFIYRSGGADGSDKAGESGVVDNRKEIYIPWKGFNKSDSQLFKIVDSDDAIKIASENHPAYEYLKPPVKKLMNRNVYQVLGYDLKTPSEFIICYTSDGCKSHLTRTSKTGGTGLAISVASKLGIPIINLGDKDDLELIKNLIKSIDEKDKNKR